MPTTKPRIYLTLGPKDEAAIAVLGPKWGKEQPMAAPDVIRKALRERAAQEGKDAK